MVAMTHIPHGRVAGSIVHLPVAGYWLALPARRVRKRALATRHHKGVCAQRFRAVSVVPDASRS